MNEWMGPLKSLRTCKMCENFSWNWSGNHRVSCLVSIIKYNNCAKKKMENSSAMMK